MNWNDPTAMGCDVQFVTQRVIIQPGWTSRPERTSLSDDPVLAALARLEANVARLEANIARLEANGTRLEASVARVETEQTRMREQFGNKLDDILDKLRVVREDTDTTRAHVLYGLQENLSLSQRVTKLENEIRRPLT